MISLALLLLAQSPNPSAYFRQADGGLTMRTWADGVTVSGGGGSGGTVTQGPGQDGGVWAVYVAGQAAGAGSSVTQGYGFDGGGWWNVAVNSANIVDTNNTTSVALGANAVFTGTATDVTAHSQVSVFAYSNVASATNGLSVQASVNGTNWDDTATRTVAANTATHISIPVSARYVRVVYTNNSAAQTSFRLQTILKPISSVGTIGDISVAPVIGDQGMLVQAVISGLTTGGGGGYVPVKVNPSGALTVETTQSSIPWLVAGADGGDVVVDQGQAADGGSNWNVWVSNWPTVQTVDIRDGGIVTVGNFPATQTISGTVAATQSGAWTVGANIIDGGVVVLNTPPVSQSGTWTVQPGNTANTTPWLVTSRVVGNSGAIVDAANNATAPANVLVQGFEAQSSALSTSATAGNVRRAVVGLDGVQYVRNGGPLLFSGGVTAIAATLTQIVAAPAAGTSLYVTDISAVSDTATAGQMTLRYGTGANCVTGTTTLWPAAAAVTTGKFPYPANTAASPSIYNFSTPLKVPAANALCIICVATNTCTASVQGYTAP